MKRTVPIAAALAAMMTVSSLGATAALAAPPHATPPTVQSDTNIIQVASKKNIAVFIAITTPLVRRR